MFGGRGWRTWKFTLAGGAGALALMFGSQFVFDRMGPHGLGTSRVLIPTLGAAVAIAWAFVMAALAFRQLDEFQQAAGRFAWYWGGSLGMAFSVVGYVFIGQGGLHWLDPAHFGLGKDLFRAFAIGYALGIGGPVLGFFAMRLWWQAAKR
jgi:hypothetical protein